MATVLSSWFDSEFKSYFSYSTSSTNTTYSITVTEAGVYQDCTWSEYNWKTELSATSNSTTTGSVGVTYWNKGYHALITADETYTFTRKTSSYKVTVSAKSTQVATGLNATASQTFTIPALPSYTVSYNANGGSGAPSSQTKWYGVTLTLSSTKPTRSGYTFVGWGVSTTDTDVNYSAGGSFTANQDFTLYAIWEKTITLSYNANSGSGAPSVQSATVYNATTSNTFTVSSTKPTRTGYNFLGWSTSSSATSASYVAGDKITLSSSDTLYAVWKLITYTVTYDANEGTNPPSAQTKTYGTDLVLSSTSPSRFGYNFLGWATSADATVAEYSAGGVYKTNANLSLYAVWERAIFTVTYDANGGTNAPASQEKVYETDLILTSDEPTRKYHAFKGWAESQTATVPTYLAGGTYSSNVDITLYAVWEVTYLIPRITSVSVVRCDENGEPQDDGTYALVKFNWATDEDVTSIRVYWKKSTDVSYVDNQGIAATGRSGSVSQAVGGGAISEDSAYNFTISVADSTDSNSATQSIGNTKFPIDLLSGGKGVTIGEPAKEEGFIVKFMSKFKSMVNVLTDFTFRTNDKGEDEIVDSDGLSVLIPKTTSGNTTLGYGGYANESKATNIYGNNVQVFTKNGVAIGKVVEEEYGNMFDVGLPTYLREDTHIAGALTYDIPYYNDEADLNEVTTSGMYYFGTTTTNRPIAHNGWLEVKSYDDGNYVYQRYVAYTGEIFERFRNAGTWGEWKCTNGDYVVEQGTDGIWTYRKWASGIAECWYIRSTLTGQQGSASMILGGYWYYRSYNFPFEFVSPPLAVANGRTGSGLGHAFADTDTTYVIVHIIGNQNVSSMTTSCYVIGKWK